MVFEVGSFSKKYNKEGVALCHLHIYQDDSPEIARHIAFRDYLRVNRAVALNYSELKRQLAAECTDDINAYMNGKDTFIRKIEVTAMEEQPTLDSHSTNQSVNFD